MVKNELPKLKGQFNVENQQQSNNNALDKIPRLKKYIPAT